MTTAQVEVLTAEVRTLMVGSRQVTLSVYRQLDDVSPLLITPFGRVRDGKAEKGDIQVVGVDEGGNLVRSHSRLERHDDPRKFSEQTWKFTWDHYSDRATLLPGEDREPSAQVAYEFDGWEVYVNRPWGCAGLKEGRDVNEWHFTSQRAFESATGMAHDAIAKAHQSWTIARPWSDLPLIVLAGLR